jgi:phage/plasmid-associated DNA primase
MIYSTNKPPIVKDEDSFAFWRRWVVLNCPNTFTGDKKDPDILAKITTPEALSGLLLLALDGLDRVMINQKFSYNKSVDETTEYYLQASDPVYAFVSAKCELDVATWVAKDDLYDAYADYCKEMKMPIMKPNAFARSLTNQISFHLRTEKPSIGGKRIYVWAGIKFIEPPSGNPPENGANPPPVQVSPKNEQLKLDTNVQDVQDVHDFSVSIVKLQKSDILQNNNNTEKNPDNPDNLDRQTQKPSSATTNNLDTPKRYESFPQPPAKLEKLGKCPVCGKEDTEGIWVDNSPDGFYYYCTVCHPNLPGKIVSEDDPNF